MRPIKDIRVYKSLSENADGLPMPAGVVNRELAVVLHRVAMKLSEKGFTLGDFDHIYIDLTCFPTEGGIAPSKRSIDRYHSWYRWYEAEVSRELYGTLESPECIPVVIEILGQVLTRFFSTAEFGSEAILACVNEAVTAGEDMLVVFREKTSARNRAVIYLRYTDSGKFFPLLRVYGGEDELMLEKDLPLANSLDAYGTIQLSAKEVTIKPRKNAFSSDLAPMIFEL
ncbi:hypothetical protein [Ruminococcus sp.]|uniref:hypothetical protein n=1 Tax=Ruminococcus sp. TaxID=41978 RepID=UPI0025E2BF22|nr:hypothetical protein [Ruminococcus sp.]MBQ8965543.1 hypothetical protein [Ruminococcus sp.]